MRRSRVGSEMGRRDRAPTGHIPFTPRAKKGLELSLREALQLGHNYSGTEHILLGLIREGEGVAAQVLVKLGADLARVRQQVIQLISGYQGGLLDEVLMRLFDSLLSLPALLLALLLLGSLGPSRNSVLAVIVVVYTPIVARVVRSAVLPIKARGFVEAARVQGEPRPYILFREILPSTLPSLAVEAALRFSYAIFLVASLGFLGVGVQPPSPDWGLMVKEARDIVTQAPWALYFPAGAIATVVVGVNLLADSLKRILQVPSQLVP